jgi:hypothetical protein
VPEDPGRREWREEEGQEGQEGRQGQEEKVARLVYIYIVFVRIRTLWRKGYVRLLEFESCG